MDIRTIIRILQRHEKDFRNMGILHISVFGSWAKGSASKDSDIDIAVRLDHSRKLDLTDFAKMRSTLSQILKSEIDLVSEPVRFKPRLQAEIDKHRIAAF